MISYVININFIVYNIKNKFLIHDKLRYYFEYLMNNAIIKYSFIIQIY